VACPPPLSAAVHDEHQVKPDMGEGAPSMKAVPCRFDAPRPALRSAHSSLQRASQVKPDINPLTSPFLISLFWSYFLPLIIPPLNKFYFLTKHDRIVDLFPKELG